MNVIIPPHPTPPQHTGNWSWKSSACVCWTARAVYRWDAFVCASESESCVRNWVNFVCASESLTTYVAWMTKIRVWGKPSGRWTKDLLQGDACRLPLPDASARSPAVDTHAVAMNRGLAFWVNPFSTLPQRGLESRTCKISQGKRGTAGV